MYSYYWINNSRDLSIAVPVAKIRRIDMASNTPHAYVTRLELQNIRAFETLAIDFQNLGSESVQARMLSVIIGRNGTCKSTLLRCLALAMCSVSDANALLSQPNAQIVRYGMDSASITLHFVQPPSGHTGTIKLNLAREGERDIAVGSSISSQDVRFFVWGYGAGRGGIGDTRFKSYQVFDSVMSLFDYEHNLLNPELMLRRLEDYLGQENYNRAIKGIQRVLGLGPNHRIYYRPGGGIYISGPGVGSEIPLDSWADGYRLTFRWIMDLYGRAIQAEAIDQNGDIQGILLVDEIEQHLHPSMQADLITNLRQALPRMQVFATTHSPLTALGAQAENLIALHRDESIVYRAAVPSLTGFSAEDVLTEQALFGTNPYSEITQSKLNLYNELKVKQPEERTDDETQQLQALAADLSPGNLPDVTDDPVNVKLDELLNLLKRNQEK
jgi:energy-coupling factor transporter ATP-binding protein EcfA2